MPTLWPFAVAIGLFLAMLAHLLPAPSAVLTVRVMSALAFAIAVIFSIPGVA